MIVARETESLKSTLAILSEIFGYFSEVESEYPVMLMLKYQHMM